MMNTAESLKEQFGCIYPKLAKVSEYYLGMNEDTTKSEAAKGKIPFHIFKASNSNKAPWLVDVRDLADWLSKQQKK